MLQLCGLEDEDIYYLVPDRKCWLLYSTPAIISSVVHDRCGDRVAAT